MSRSAFSLDKHRDMYYICITSWRLKKPRLLLALRQRQGKSWKTWLPKWGGPFLSWSATFLCTV